MATPPRAPAQRERRGPPAPAAVAVSVILPAYRAAATLPATLASLFAQTFADFEVIVVDDASPDHTWEVLLATPAPRPLLALRSAHNQGPAAARNLALAHARGQVLAFADADDVFYPDKLARQYAALCARRPAAVANFCAAHDEQGRLQTRQVGTRFADDLLLFRQDIISTSGLLCWRDTVQALGGFPHGLRAKEDVALVVRLLQHGAVDYLPQSLYRKNFSGRRRAQVILAGVEAFWRTFAAELQALPDRHRARAQGALYGRLAGLALTEGEAAACWTYLTRGCRASPGACAGALLGGLGRSVRRHRPGWTAGPARVPES